MVVEVWEPDTAVHTEAPPADVPASTAATTHATTSAVSTVSIRVISVVERFRQARDSIMRGREFTQDSTEVIRRMREERSGAEWQKPSQ